MAGFQRGQNPVRYLTVSTTLQCRYIRAKEGLMASTSTALAVPLENFTNRIELGLELYIDTLPNLAHDELLLVRTDARALAKFGWRLECAADAELTRRLDPK